MKSPGSNYKRILWAELKAFRREFHAEEGQMVRRGRGHSSVLEFMLKWPPTEDGHKWRGLCLNRIREKTSMKASIFSTKKGQLALVTHVPVAQFIETDQETGT